MRTIPRITPIWSAVLLLLVLGVGAAHTSPVAILGAFDEEVEILEGQLVNPKAHTIEGIQFLTGTLNEQNVVIAKTGVGKVNAAMTATLMTEHFHPNCVIFTGVAGGLNPDLQIGDIVIAQKTAQHDLGRLESVEIENTGVRNPINGRRNPVFFPADPGLLRITETALEGIELNPFQTPQGQRHPRIIRGTVVTGDVFVASDARKTALHKNLGADAVEMEGAAVAQICWQHNVPCLVIRSLSDNAGANASEDFKKYYKIAARNSAALVTRIISQLHSEQSMQPNTTMNREQTQDSPVSPKQSALTPNEQQFQETLSGVTLVGHFTITGGEDSDTLREEKYTITKVTKLSDDYWFFFARIQYGGRDVTVPLKLEVKWADDTPIITLTDLELPGLGTYTARVIIYRGQYAGTWSGGRYGGHLFGTITKNTPQSDDIDPQQD
jgi:adenosylhomocysteine nucleosidase